MDEERAPAWVGVLTERANIYRTKQAQHGARSNLREEYTREDVEQLKAEAVELALYEALIASGLPAEAPEWMA